MLAWNYDHGTHYVTNQKLTLETLKEISNSEDIMEVTGEYTGSIGGLVPPMNMQVTDIHMITILHGNNSNLGNKPDWSEEKKIYRSLNNHKLLIYTAVGIIGAIVISWVHYKRRAVTQRE